MPDVILIVDDHPDLRSDLCHYAKEVCRGWHVEEAADREEALRRLEAQRYTAVVTDLELGPDDRTGGFEILEQGKARYPETEFIVVTSYPLPEHASVARRLGAFDYLPRGIPRVDFSEILKWRLRYLRTTIEARREECSELTCHIQGRDSLTLSLRGALRYDQSVSLRGSLWPELTGALVSHAGWLVHSHSVEEARRLRLAVCQHVGRWLWEQVFERHPELMYALGLGAGATRSSQPLVLRFVTAPDQLEIPFELLCRDGDFLSRRYPVVRDIVPREFRADRCWHSRGPLEPVRVVLIASNTWDGRDLEEIEGVEQEVSRVEERIRNMRGVSTTRLDSRQVSFDLIGQRLRQGFDVVFYAGHATYDSAEPGNSSIYFWTDGEDSELRDVTADELVRLIGSTPPRLFYLSSCVAARTGTQREGLYGGSLGIVHALATRCGIPTIVGHRWPLLDGDSAARFSVDFFASLLGPSGTPEMALFDAVRRTLHSDPTWASAVMVDPAP